MRAMDRRDFLRMIAAAPAAGTVLHAASARADAKAGGKQTGRRRPNLLYIMTDQQPTSMLGAYGNKLIRTPNLDRLAREGVRFTQFHIGAFPCTPSRSCMLTGRWAHRTGVVRNDVPLPADVPCLGDILRREGYSTAYVGKWHLSGMMYRNLPGRKPFDGAWYYRRVPDEGDFRFEAVRGGTGEDEAVHGFDHWVGGWKHYQAYLRSVGLGELIDQRRGNLGNHDIAPSGGEHEHIHSLVAQEHHMSAFLADRAAELIRKQPGASAGPAPSRPFCLVLSFYGPHIPVAPPRPWDDMCPLEKTPLPANHRDELAGKPFGQRRSQQYVLGKWTEAQFRDYIRRYHGYCSYIDHQVGKVLKALDETGQMDDTIVAFTSDHGDMVGAHGMIRKLGCAYDELMRVPMLLRYPRLLPGGAVRDALVSNVDLLPTLLEMIGLDAPKGLDGRSFLAVARGRADSFRDAVFTDCGSRILLATTRRWKYGLTWGGQGRDLDELYDRLSDPGELRNLAADPAGAEALRKMQDLVRAWLKQARHPYAGTILAAMEKKPDLAVVDLWPEITHFRYLGGSEFEYAWVWHAVDAAGQAPKRWSFTHFTRGRGQIAFRNTRWPEPRTTQWQAGKDYPLGTARIEVPADAPAGTYGVRIGLFDPTRKGPQPILARGSGGNFVEVGTLTIRRKAGEVVGVSFQAGGPR